MIAKLTLVPPVAPDASPVSGVISRQSEFALQEPAAISAHLREVIRVLDDLLESVDPFPKEGDPCPRQIEAVERELTSLGWVLRSSKLTLLGRVVERTRAFAARLVRGTASWHHMSKLGLEELISVVDMVVDVVELVNTDSGCRHEERISFRILADVDPPVLAQVDALNLAEIRFHQASARSARKLG
jgi:hypothetical protein